MTPLPTPANAKKVALLQQAVKELLSEVLRRGFYGTAAVELSIQDGAIQHVRRRLDRIEK